MTLLMLGATAQASEKTPDSTPTVSLGGLVAQFLAARTAEDAEHLQAAILMHPEATLHSVRTLIEAGPVYGAQPTGSQPAVPLSVRGTEQHYALYVPPTYTPATAFPLVVCLHGAGFTGDAYLERWVPRLGDAYIVACPTEYQGMWWTRFAEELVLATIEDVRSRYRIDMDRIYLTGMSNGGIGAWLIGMQYAPYFAGIAPMAGGLDDVLYPFLQNLSRTPIYIIHGAEDQVMPVTLSREIVKHLIDLGIPHVYKEHRHVHPHAGGHFFPREELPGLIAWFGQQKRDPFPKKLTVVRDASHLMSFGWIRIDATDQIAAFSEELIDRRDELIRGRVYARAHAEVVGGNRIVVKTDRVRRLTLFLTDELIDLVRPVTVEINGTVVFQGSVEAHLETLLKEVRFRKDPRMLFSAELTLDVP